MSHFAPARSRKIWGRKAGRSCLRKQSRQLEVAKTVAAKSECPDLWTLNLTSFAQNVAFFSCQKSLSWKVLTKEASKTVRSHHVKFPDCGILNLTSLAQCVTFCASQRPQNLRTQSWNVLTKDANQTVGSRKFGSCKDGCLKLRMSSLMNIEPYIFAKHVAFWACRKPQNLRTVSW